MDEIEQAAEVALSLGDEYPFHGQPPKDWAERAASGCLQDLEGRSSIGNALEVIEDDETRVEIVQTLAAIIRRAQAES